MNQEEFYNRVKIGDQIPPLEKETTLWQRGLPEIFGIPELATESDEAQKKAEDLGIDPIHTSSVLVGCTCYNSSQR